MRVCLLNDSFPPVIDGVVNVMMNYADYLMKDYASQVIVGTPRYPDTDYTVYPYPVVPYQSFDTAAMASGYRTGNPFEGKAVSELAAFAPDVIHSHCPASATVIARLLREETGAPIIFTYHTKYDIDLRRTFRVKPIAEETIRLMVSNIEACDDIWTVSRGAGESLKALGFKGDYLVMNNGVDFAKGRVDKELVRKVTEGYDLPDGVPMFLFVGRIITYKGLPLLLDALRILAQTGQDFRMVFVGKGPDRELLENKAREYGLMGKDGEPDKCIFVGPVYDREQLRAWNTRADLFLFPSTFDTNGLVVREAAACGLASVLIEGSCAAEGIENGRNGFTVEETPEAMAALLTEIAPDLDHLHDVGQHAMDEIYLSWKDCVGTAFDRYQVILERKAKGLLPAKKKVPADYLISLTAAGMEQGDKLRRMSEELFGNFRDVASGMMENFQDTDAEGASFWEGISQSMRDSLFFGLQESQNVKEQTMQSRYQAMVNAWHGLSDSVQKAKGKAERFWSEAIDNIEKGAQGGLS